MDTKSASQQICLSMPVHPVDPGSPPPETENVADRCCLSVVVRPTMDTLAFNSKITKAYKCNQPSVSSIFVTYHYPLVFTLDLVAICIVFTLH